MEGGEGPQKQPSPSLIGRVFVTMRKEVGMAPSKSDCAVKEATLNC